MVMIVMMVMVVMEVSCLNSTLELLLKNLNISCTN